MSDSESIEFSPLSPFATPGGFDGPLPAAFGGPLRYVQGDGVIDHAGAYLQRLGMQRVGVLMSGRSRVAEGARLLASLAAAGIAAEVCTFGGECSLEEIAAHVDTLCDLDHRVDGLVAIGGGKSVDAGKAIAHRLSVPSVVVPSLASNDAPCAALSVIYTPEGVTADAEIYDQSPALVLVDTGVIAGASERYLVAGMGDAMATWYEARACMATPDGVTVFGGRPTLAGGAIARLCVDTLFAHGPAAAEAVRLSSVTPDLEKIVEANTLLSGLGYESGGLAAAHAYAQGFTVLESVHRRYLHGEMVAIGTLAQLALEGEAEEAARVARFFTEVGLPVHLGHLGLSGEDESSLAAVVQGALAFPFLDNMPGDTTAPALMEALQTLDVAGRQMVSDRGDGAYRALHD